MPVTAPKIIMEDIRLPVKLVEFKPPQPSEVDDDWFVLLDTAAKQPGIPSLYGCFAKSIT